VDGVVDTAFVFTPEPGRETESPAAFNSFATAGSVLRISMK